MTEKGLRVLEAVIQEFGPAWIEYVIAARDPQLRNDSFDEIRALCRQHDIAFYERGDTVPAGPTFAFAVSWRWLIADVPKLIVLHDSLLPKYRGFAPLPTALIKGDQTIGVTAVLAADNYDRGDIVGQKALSISYPIKIHQAIQNLTPLYTDLVLDICRMLKADLPLVQRRQDESKATYSLWRDDADYAIDWTADSIGIKRFIDSLGYPYKGASSFLNGRRVRVHDADVEPDVQIENRQAGKVIFVHMACPVVVCGRGLLRITDLRDAETDESLLPLKKFRSRFSTCR